MTTTEGTATATNFPFTESDYTELKEAHDKLQNFKNFVLDRFKVFALAHEDMDVDARVKQAGGYLTVKVDEHSLFNENLQEITIYFVMADDRAASTHTAYKLPKVFLFKNSEQEEDYAQYLHFKNKVFGNK